MYTPQQNGTWVVPATNNLRYKWKDLTIGPQWNGGAAFTPASGLGVTPRPHKPATGADAGFAVSPILWATRLVAMHGLGADPSLPLPPGVSPTTTPGPDPADPGTGAAVATGAIGAALLVAAVAVSLSAVAGFYAGKAMAPASSKKSMWGVYGAVSAVFTGWLGLGILGGVSLAQRNEL